MSWWFYKLDIRNLLRKRLQELWVISGLVNLPCHQVSSGSFPLGLKFTWISLGRSVLQGTGSYGWQLLVRWHWEVVISHTKEKTSKIIGKLLFLSLCVDVYSILSISFIISAFPWHRLLLMILDFFLQIILIRNFLFNSHMSFSIYLSSDCHSS